MYLCMLAYLYSVCMYIYMYVCMYYVDKNFAQMRTVALLCVCMYVCTVCILECMYVMNAHMCFRFSLDMTRRTGRDSVSSLAGGSVGWNGAAQQGNAALGQVVWYLTLYKQCTCMCMYV